MIWFEYKYTTSSEIMNNIKLITDYSIIEYIVLTLLIIVIILVIYYIIPAINTYFTFKRKEIELNKRKEMLRQIILQKNINEEIEKELKNI